MTEAAGRLLASDVLRGALVVVPTLLLALGVAASFAALGGAGRVGMTLAVALAALLAFFAPRVRARLSERTWTHTGLALVALFSALSVGWALAFDSVQGSDFGVYYRCGTRAAGGLEEQVAQCQSRFVSPNTIYWTRSLLSTRPFGVVFGDWPKGLDLYDAALHAASLALLFWLVRRAHGPAAAAMAVLVWGVFPERVFAVTLATSDHMSALVVLGLLAVSSAAGPVTARRGVLGAALLAVGLFAVEALRNAGALFALAAMAAPLASNAEHGLRRASLAVAGVVGFAACSGALSATLPRLGEPRSLSGLLAATDLTSDQGFAVTLRWTDHLWRAIPPEQRTSVALRGLETELSGNAAMYPRYVARKAGDLFRGDGYAFFASADLRANPDTELTVPRSTVPASSMGEFLPRAVLAALATLAMAGLLSARKDPLTLTATAVLAVVLGVVLLLGEAQPRYLFVPGPAMAILAASPWSTTPGEARPARTLLLGLLVVCSGVLLFAAWAAVLVRVRPPVLPLASLAVDRGCTEEGAALQPGLRRALLTLPAGTRCAVVRLPVPAGAHAVRLLVTRAEFPFAYEPPQELDVSWWFEREGVHLSDGHLDGETARFHRFELPQSTARELEVHFNRATAQEPIRMELTEVQFE